MNDLAQKTLETLEWDALLRTLSDRITSEPGKSYVQKIAPLSAENARDQLSLITEVKEGLIQGKWCDFSELHDVMSQTFRASKGSVLSTAELFTIRSTLRAFTSIQRFYKENQDILPRAYKASLLFMPLPELTQTLVRAFTDDGDINGATYPVIGRIEKSIRDTRHDIERALAKIIHAAHMEDVLQEKIHSIRSERYCLLVKANMKSRLKGTVLDISASSATIFVEPEQIASLNDTLLMKRAELEREIEKIIAELSEMTGAYHAEITHNLEYASYLDYVQGAAKLSRDIKGAAPLITDTPVIDLVRVRHPLLQLLINDENIPNDVSLGKKASCLVITGANTGGKTVLLKSIGLAVLCASHGIHIAASPDSSIGIFTSVMADIGDDQNLAQSLSTFSGQIVALNAMLDSCDNTTLILLDEIMAGTNPRHGAALAQSILESFASRGARVAVTTHYPELRNLAVQDTRFANASVSFNVDSLRPTYELITGIPGASYTFEIAGKYGMPGSVIHRAKEITSGDELSTEALLEKINTFKDEIANEKREIDRLSIELAHEKTRYEEMQKSLRDETRKVKKAEGIAFIDELRTYRELVSERIRTIHTADAKSAEAFRNELDTIEKDVSASVKGVSLETLSESHARASARTIEPGLQVFVIPLEKDGIVEECNEEKRIAVVRLGSIFSRYSYDDLLIPEQKKTAAPAKKAYRSTVSHDGIIPITVQTSYNTIDLRGMRVDEAINAVDESLDRMSRSGITSAVIIHGHGTGALKTAVRQHLKQSPYIQASRPGEQSEGGDGVSIVLIV